MKQSLALFAFALIIGLTSCNNKEEANTEQNETEKVGKVRDKKQESKVNINYEEQIGKLISFNSVNNNGGLPDFTFEINGKQHTFAEYTKGKKVLFNVWGTWCPPCRAELPDLVELSNENKDWLFIGLTVERQPGITDARKIEGVTKFIEKFKIPYLNLLGDDRVIGQILQASGFQGSVPTTYYISTEGKVVDMNMGALPKSGFQSKLDAVK